MSTSALTEAVLPPASERAAQFLADSVLSTVGTYLARRMVDVGVKDYFVVPGDFNLLLLDEILRFPQMRLVSCCSELNAGYAADGYARATGGVAVMFVTFTVGSLSAINAIAGAYSADLPVVIVCGGPNHLDYGSDRILHHTIGEENRSQEVRCFEQVTSKAIEIRHPWQAPAQIDIAFSTALKERKPVYISLACNISTAPVPMPIPFHIERTRPSNPESLAAAVEAVYQMWAKSVNPVVVAGVKTRSSNARHATVELARTGGCGLAVMPDTKGMIDETFENFIGVWWGQISSPCTAAVVDSADLQIFVGPLFNDYSTVGYTALLIWNRIVRVEPNRVITPRGEYGCVYMAEFVLALAKRIDGTPKDMSMKTYRRLQKDEPAHPYVPNADPSMPLTTRNIDNQVQQLLTPDKALLVETGDSWFHGQKMHLPSGCGYEFQMQYGSIGWSVGALLGYAMGFEGKKRVVAMIGDGSFQLTAQEVSTMIRYNQNPIIFLINNAGYTIEVEIHDGIYNITKNWDYKGLVDVFSAGEGNTKSWRARTEAELVEAVKEAEAHNGLAFIECVTDKDDCTRELLEWGTRVAIANGRQVDTAHRR